jgi:hypothetical protein
MKYLRQLPIITGKILNCEERLLPSSSASVPLKILPIKAPTRHMLTIQPKKDEEKSVD